MRAIGVTRARATVLIAVFIVVLFGIPAIPLGNWNHSSLSPVGQASASGPGNRVIRIGEPDFTLNMATLNPLLYTQNEEMETIWPCYSTLLTFDVNKNIIGDLATSWDVSPDGTLWHFKLSSGATFYDMLNPTAVHPVTAADVIFTYYLVQNNTNSLQTYLPNVRGQNIISSMWAVNNFELYLRTSMPYAPMRATLVNIPILPQYIWSTQKFNWANFDSRLGIPPIVGSGPWYYALSGLPTTGTVELDRNPTWFATQERGWQIHASKLIYKSETSTDTALSDLRTGAIDIDAYPSAGQYLDTLPGMPGVNRWSLVTGGLYEFNMNQMSDAARAAFGGKYKSGSANQLLQDPVVKDALQMCIDKQSWVDGFLSGLAAPADSLIGPKNEFHYDYGARPGETPYAFDTSGARAMLNAAGWNYDTSGNLNPGATPLCKLGGTDPLKFRFWTLNDGLDQSNWNTGARMIADWAWLAGIDLKTLYAQQSISFMNGAWAAADYDCWVWDWWFGSTSEASTDIMSVLTTAAIGSWSDVYWMNSTFNNLYNQSLIETDFAARYATLADMQAIAYKYSGCVPLAYRAELFGATNQGPDQWTNWGNWNTTWLLEPGELPWLYMQIYPESNHAPTVTAGSPTFNGYVNSPISVFGSATDDSGGSTSMKYQWYWGDGTSTGWQTSWSQTHTYAHDGVYTAYFSAQEQTTTDAFMSWDKTTITVVDVANLPPIISSITMTPSSGIKAGMNVTFSCAASDPNGDPLTYSWDFGDSHTATGQTVYHKFMAAGSYTVTAYVDDGHPGAGRPATAQKLVSVTINHPPSISIISSQTVIWKATAWFNATASDADNEPLRFTWVWGDGSMRVTTSPKNVTHAYQTKATYDLYVHADDLSGLPGHNVSALCKVTVSQGHTIPYGLTLSVNRSSIWVSQSLLFTATAQDPGGDGLHFSINCGDGSYVNVDMPSTAPNAVVTATAPHTYNFAGTMTARQYVTDGLDNTTGSTPVLITVTLNNPPVVTPLTNKNIWAGSSTTFTASAVDPDGESMRYTWNFGDGTALAAGASTTHTYTKAGIYTFTVFVNDLTGLAGHNVSSSATASVAFNMPLLAGWNFVSVPVVGFGYKASTLGLTTGDVVVSWSPPSQAYDHNYIKGISPPTADFNILPNTGYWIWVAAAKTLHLYGSVPTTQQTVTFAVPAGGGWIAIGFSSLKTTWHAADIPTMYSGPVGKNITLVTRYTGSGYITYIRGTPLNNYLLVPGQAYWCWVEASGTLSYMP